MAIRSDFEMLTRNGWKRIDEITKENEVVLIYDPLSSTTFFENIIGFDTISDDNYIWFKSVDDVISHVLPMSNFWLFDKNKSEIKQFNHLNMNLLCDPYFKSMYQSFKIPSFKNNSLLGISNINQQASQLFSKIILKLILLSNVFEKGSVVINERRDGLGLWYFQPFSGKISNSARVGFVQIIQSPNNIKETPFKFESNYENYENNYANLLTLLNNLNSKNCHIYENGDIEIYLPYEFSHDNPLLEIQNELSELFKLVTFCNVETNKVILKSLKYWLNGFSLSDSQTFIQSYLEKDYNDLIMSLFDLIDCLGVLTGAYVRRNIAMENNKMLCNISLTDYKYGGHSMTFVKSEKLNSGNDLFLKPIIRTGFAIVRNDKKDIYITQCN